MLTEPINISVKSVDPPAKARSPAVKAITQDGREAVRTGREPDLSRMTEAVANVQKNLNMIDNVDLHFTVHEASGDIMVIVTKESTGEVIREIPPLEILNLAAKLDVMIGIIFDQKG